MKNGLFLFNVERNRSWGKRYEPPLTAPKAGLHPKKVMLCIWWDWKGIVYYELLSHNQTINSDKYCSQLDRLKAAIDEKRPELVNRKGVVFHQTTPDLTSRCILGKNWYNLAGMSYLTRHIHPILHFQITTYSGPYRIPLMERTSILWKPVKTTWSSSSPRKMPSSGRMESWSYLKDGEK